MTLDDAKFRQVSLLAKWQNRCINFGQSILESGSVLLAQIENANVFLYSTLITTGLL